ncbi:formylmethanofuran dehydrogenase subunit A [Candidatus Hecatella orcuttiae]|uniref:formylmethanofuran dehydrogenase subunit A n=1 Tax=Candidatus Hecatella orcuttiae TaxID=1935119 RepID=UPI00286809DA|nr:formylmethanofuran dehydrogenase subunit A [Candidatus Hecatella orcuttiae]
MELLIKNGIVFDPLNGIDGQKMDIAIRDGKVVESVSSGARVIDASNLMVMPGGVDLHSHIAGSKVNAGRLMRPEDHFRDPEAKTPTTRSGVGSTVPSVFTTGYRYAKMGYTTVFEPATPMLKARHTHDELDDIPILDKACFPLFGNDVILLEYLKAGRIEEAAGYVAWMLEAVKGYAIKIVNPGGLEAWNWGGNVLGLDEEVPNFGITPREIVRSLCKISKMLNLPHPIHLHPNNLGRPGNYETTIETMDCVRDLAGEKPVIHLTHVQFEGYGGRDWLSMSSEGVEIANYVNRHGHVSIDLGQLVFGNATTMTADGPFQFQLYQLTGNKWTNSDVEVETSAGVVPYFYKRSNYVNAIQWTVGLELALAVRDPWRVFLTTDHPNAGPFTAYPKVIAWLMSRKARERVLSKIPRMARKRSNLSSLDREYSFSEIAVVTRAGTARSLGLKNKGHLGVGADADVAVYPLNPREVDPSKDYKKVRKAFGNAVWVVKEGQVVVEKGEIKTAPRGKTFWVKPDIEEDVLRLAAANLKAKFREYYTVEFDNFIIPEDALARPQVLKAG